MIVQITKCVCQRVSKQTSKTAMVTKIFLSLFLSTPPAILLFFRFFFFSVTTRAELPIKGKRKTPAALSSIVSLVGVFIYPAHIFPSFAGAF